jgi:aspartate-semialdehyde dehydrogenase
MSKTPEGEFRDELSAAMKGRWLMTWHEDREINPGVPDISYVIHGDNNETGWLELKAIRPQNRISIQIEQSQHMWISLHCNRVPVHFAVKIGSLVYVIDGAKHRELASAKLVKDIYDMSILVVTDMKSQLPKLLRSFTNRGRYVSRIRKDETSIDDQSGPGHTT